MNHRRKELRNISFDMSVIDLHTTKSPLPSSMPAGISGNSNEGIESLGWFVKTTCSEITPVEGCLERRISNTATAPPRYIFFRERKTRQ